MRQQLEEFRANVPDAVGAMAQVMVDNPASMLMVACGSYVIGAGMVNLVKPRGLPGLLAVAIVSYGLSTAAAAELIKRGILTVRIRDDKGELIPLAKGHA